MLNIFNLYENFTEMCLIYNKPVFIGKGLTQTGEVFCSTWLALQMSFRGIFLSGMELSSWFYSTHCARH